MKILDDLSHQLFSEILLSSRENQSIKFEDQTFASGSGFVLQDQNSQESLILSEKLGLLGLHHPLQIKSYLKAALEPHFFAEDQDRARLIKGIERLFGKILEIPCFITDYNVELFSAKGAGRFARLISKSDELYLRDHGQLTIRYLFPFSFTLSLDKTTPAYTQQLTVAQYEYSNALVKLLDHGPFYKDPFIIEERSKIIEEKLSSLPIVQKTEGLSVSLHQKISPSCGIYSDDHILHFPLFYNESMVDNVVKKIKEYYVHC